MLVMIFIQLEDEYYNEKSTFESFGLLMQYHQVALIVFQNPNNSLAREQIRLIQDKEWVSFKHYWIFRSMN